jgi:hypothetical protein
MGLEGTNLEATMLRIVAASSAFLMGLAPLSVFASPADDLTKIKAAFTAAKSWHATEQLPDGKTINLDFSAPDRWRIQPTPQITELLIGNDVYMVRNGKTTHVPIPGGMLRKTIDSFEVAPLDEDIKKSAQDLGPQSVNGQTLRGYAFTSHGTPVKLYVDSGNLPIQAVVTTNRGPVTIIYSAYNTPIDISP